MHCRRGRVRRHGSDHLARARRDHSISNTRCGGVRTTVGAVKAAPQSQHRNDRSARDAATSGANAERIIEYRTKSGSFKRIEELMNVKGIGEKSFLKLKPLIVVPPKTDKAPGD